MASRYALGLNLVLLVAAPGAWAETDDATPKARLQVVTAAGKALFDAAIAPGSRWCLIWNHSVTGIRVADCYRYQTGRMVLERSHQPDFAAGLGHIPGRGEQVSDGEGGYWIKHIDEPVPGNAYLLRVGSPAVDHRIRYRNKMISLSERAAGERVSVRLRPNDDTQ